MRKAGSRISKVIAGGMAMLMALGSSSVPLDSVADTFTAKAAARIKIDSKTFPDKTFMELILSSDYDRNGDTYLDDEEITLARNIYCDGMDIKSLKGIEVFTELQGLHCTDNELTTLDVSKNTELRGVWCSGNKFTSLDFSKNKELLWLYCFDCSISTLNIAQNTKMSYLEVSDNPLKKLDLSPFKDLEHLICASCELDKLDFTYNKKLTHIDAMYNHFTKLDVTGLTKLKRLDIWGNTELGEIDISKNTGLQYYNCAYNGVKSLDVSHNPELNKLSCGYNQIKTLDLSNNPKLVYLDCACNSLGKLDVSNNPNLRFLQAFTNPFTTLSIGDCPYLVKTYKEGVKVYEGDVCDGHSWTIDYGEDDSTQGDSIFFLCFDDKIKLSTTATKPVPAYPEEKEPSDTRELVKREEFVQRLYKLAGSPSVKGLKTRFTDVKAGASYEAALLWGEAHNICVGYPYKAADTFGAGKWLSRQDAALMLMRFSEYMGYKRSIDFGRSDDYLDYYDIDFDHWEAICWSATYDIMEGKGEPGAPREEQMIDPLGKATNTELYQMLRNLAEVNGVSFDLRLAGDVNGDGKVDLKDGLMFKQYLANWNVKIIAENSDVNGDKKADLKDAMLLMQYLARWKVVLK